MEDKFRWQWGWGTICMSWSGDDVGMYCLRVCSYFPPLFPSVQAFSFLVTHGVAELVPISSVYQRLNEQSEARCMHLLVILLTSSGVYSSIRRLELIESWQPSAHSSPVSPAPAAPWPPPFIAAALSIHRRHWPPPTRGPEEWWTQELKLG